MPVDLKIARPFVYQSEIDGNAYELGIALYPAMDDAFANDWHVVNFTEASVLARGGTLFQWRRLLALNPADGTYVPLPPTQPFNGHAPIFLDPNINPEYSQGIEAGWPPIFVAQCDSFPMEHPPPEAGCASGQSLGYHGYRFFGDTHRRQLHTTIKLYPGDPSPPANRSAPPDLRRTDREEIAFQRVQREQHAAVNAQAARYTSALPAAAPPPPRPITVEAAIWRDPRTQKRAA